MKVSVDAEALRVILQALIGPPHYIRELQAIRSLGDSPIDKLVTEYNELARHNCMTGKACPSCGRCYACHNHPFDSIKGVG